MGFDPRGTAFYYASLRREARVSARRGFSNFTVGPLRQQWQHGDLCHCPLPDDSDLQHLYYEFLSVKDIVEDYFSKSVFARLARGLWLLVLMIVTGFIFKTLRKAPFFTLFILYPFVVQLLGFTLLGGGVYLAITLAGLGLPAVAAWAIGIGVFVASALLISKHENRLYCYYLLGGFDFSYRMVSGSEAQVTERLETFCQHILQVLEQSREGDEILIVGHSSGALLSILLTARLLRRCTAEQARRLALLTLGNQAALGASNAHPLKNAIRELAANRDVTWREIYSPHDVICSGRFDPVEDLGLRRPEPSSFALYSAQFSAVLTPETLNRIKFNFFKVHFQYLKASETGEGFNYYHLLQSESRLADYDLG